MAGLFTPMSTARLSFEEERLGGVSKVLSLEQINGDRVHNWRLIPTSQAELFLITCSAPIAREHLFPPRVINTLIPKKARSLGKKRRKNDHSATLPNNSNILTIPVLNSPIQRIEQISTQSLHHPMIFSRMERFKTHHLHMTLSMRPSLVSRSDAICFPFHHQQGL